MVWPDTVPAGLGHRWDADAIGQRERRAADMANSPSADWYADPDGVHQLRYHDGIDWTVHVADNGAVSQAPRMVERDPGGASAGDAAELRPMLALEYGRACSAVMAASRAALDVANQAFGAWKKAQQRPQHEISIRNITMFAQNADREFAPLFSALQAAVGAARAAGIKLSSQFGDPEEAEVFLGLALDDRTYSDVDAAIHLLRNDAPPDARGFHDFILRVNHAIATTPAGGEPGFPGNIYTGKANNR
jgi:hypothetical protein